VNRASCWTQTRCIPEVRSGGLDPAKEVFWSYLPNGKLAGRTDQQGQPVSYTHDADGNLVTSHDASGLTDSSQTRSRTRTGAAAPTRRTTSTTP
jgi:YD repeat-containing protein